VEALRPQLLHFARSQLKTWLVAVLKNKVGALAPVPRRGSRLRL